MLFASLKNALCFNRIDVSKHTMGQFLRYTNSRPYHQQILHKHTLAKKTVENRKATAAAAPKIKKNNCNTNNMKTTTSSSSSVFSPYSKEESLTKMQLKHIQPQKSKQQMHQHQHQQQQQQQQHSTHQTEKSTATTAAETTSTPASAKNPIIPYNIDWIFERLKKPNTLWIILSQITVFTVGLFSKIVLVFMNTTKVYNRERLIEAVSKRPPGVPLVTVSNHHSCFDDPGLWGILPIRYVCNYFKTRWGLAAHDICYTNRYHATFFMLGKCIPVVRGYGVYQDAVDICVQKVKLGHWVHVFPEGKVNMTKEEMRLKWGVGRIIYESFKVPVVVPMWHEGMDDVLPNVEPYILKWGKKVTLNVGKPIDLNDFVDDLKSRDVAEPEARKLITDKIEDVFHKLRLETEELHRNNK